MTLFFPSSFVGGAAEDPHTAFERRSIFSSAGDAPKIEKGDAILMPQFTCTSCRAPPFLAIFSYCGIPLLLCQFLYFSTAGDEVRLVLVMLAKVGPQPKGLVI